MKFIYQWVLTRSRLSVGSIRGSFCRYTWFEKDWKIILDRTESYATFQGSKGLSESRYGTKSVTSSLQFQIVNALSSGKKAEASNFLSVLSHSDSLTSDDFVYILNYCSKSPDPLFSMETWRIMEEKEIHMDRRCYKLIIRALSRGGYLEEAFNCLSSLGKSLHSVPELPMYNVFLHGCARMGSMVHVNSCLDLMEEQMVGRSESTYVALLKFSVLQQNLSAAQEIWKQFLKSYRLTYVSFRQVIKCFLELRDVVSACEVLQHWVALVSRREISLRRSVIGRSGSLSLDIPIPSNKGFGLERCPISGTADDLTTEADDNMIDATNKAILDLDRCTDESFIDQGLESSALFPVVNQGSGFGVSSRKLEEGTSDAWSRLEMTTLGWGFDIVIRACGPGRVCKLAEQLFLQMQKLGLKPISYTYEGLIVAAVFEKGVLEGLIWLQDMEKVNLMPTGFTLGFLSIGCSAILELDLAEALLDQPGIPLSIVHFNRLLAAYKAKDQPERAVMLLTKMKQLKLNFDVNTYAMLFSLFGNVNAPYETGNIKSRGDAVKRIIAIETDMEKNGVQHNFVSMLYLVKALGREGVAEQLYSYIYKREHHICLKPFQETFLYNPLLLTLVYAKNTTTAINLFKAMKLHGLPLTYGTYGIMIYCCLINQSYKSACAYVSMMLRDGYDLQSDEYSTLMDILMATYQLDEAFKLLYQLISEGIRPKITIFNTFLRTAVWQRHLKCTDYIIEQIHRERIQPDPETVSIVFHFYLNCVRHPHAHSIAMEALQVMSMRMISEEENVLQEKSKYFEDNFIFAEDSEAELRIMKIFEEDSGAYLATALLILRWCAILGYPISWSPNQSEWAKKMSLRYCDGGS